MVFYAAWWIRQSILLAIAENARIVRLPQNRLTCIKKVNKAYLTLQQEFQRESTLEEIAQIADLEQKASIN